MKTRGKYLLNNVIPYFYLILKNITNNFNLLPTKIV